MSKWYWIKRLGTLLIIISIIGGFIIWLWSQRPIIEYSLLDFPDSFDSEYNTLSATTRIKNCGNVYSKLNLILKVKNANISLNDIEIGMTYNGTHLKIRYDLPNTMENYDMRYFDIEPIGNPKNFTVELTIENLADWSFPNGWICHWLEPHSNVAFLTYNRTDTTTYELVKS